MSAINPDHLRGLLWEAVALGDQAALAFLCRQHAPLIRQFFPHWRKLPASIRDNPDQTEKYVRAMLTIAEFFQQNLGDLTLIQGLNPPGVDNPLQRWQQNLEMARKEIEGLQYAEAIERLSAQLIDARGLSGPGVHQLLPATLGTLGEAFFQSGKASRALDPTQRALEEVTRQGDLEGQAAYQGNLYEIHRYLGQAEPAAQAAEKLARTLLQLGKDAEAERYRKQAFRVRQGEPLNRILVNLDGQVYEVDEVLGAKPGRLQFAFERNRLTLRPAEVLTQRGEKQASLGRFESALALFKQATEADPFAPQPHYLAGLTLLFLQRYAEAVTSYTCTDTLAPGWFHCRSDRWLAQQLLLGKLAQETFLLWHSAEEGSQRPHERLLITENALRQAPNLPHLHLTHGNVLRTLGQERDALDAYRRGLQVAEEADIRTRLLLNVALHTRNKAEKQALLNEAVELAGNLVAAATARIVLALEG